MMTFYSKLNLVFHTPSSVFELGIFSMLVLIDSIIIIPLGHPLCVRLKTCLGEIGERYQLSDAVSLYRNIISVVIMA